MSFSKSYLLCFEVQCVLQYQSMLAWKSFEYLFDSLL